MLIKVKKEVEETFELQTPCWLYDNIAKIHMHVNAEGDLVKVGDGLIVFYDRGRPVTNNEISDATKRAHSCTEMEFKEALDKQLYRIEEKVTA
jgi:hypothetical protein